MTIFPDRFRPLLCLLVTCCAIFVFGMQLYAASFASPAPIVVVLMASLLASLACVDWIRIRAWPGPFCSNAIPPQRNARCMALLTAVLLVLVFAGTGYSGQVSMVRQISGDVDVHTLHLFGREVFEWRADTPAEFTHVSGNIYQLRIHTPPLFTAMQDSLIIPRFSDLTVAEDNELSPWSHAWHHEIEKLGEGRYSHFGHFMARNSLLYLSTRDNDSPHEHSYRIEYRLLPSPLLLILLLMASGVHLAGSLVYQSVRGSFQNPATGHILRTMLAVFLTATFLYPLISAWSQHLTIYQLIGGYLPWSDASGWKFSATKLLHTGELLDWSQRRPLNPAIHAFFSRLTGERFNLSLLVYALLAGASAAYMMLSLQRTCGVIAGLLAMTVLVSFVDEFLPLAATETLGFILGIAGFAVMWRAIGTRSPLLFAMGLAVFTAGMSARPGPMSIFPLLLIWATLARIDGKRVSTKWAACALLGFVIGMFPNFLFGKLYGTGANLPGSNYAYTLYGLSLGGKSWHSGYEVPAEGAVTEQDRTQLVYAAAFEQIRKNPEALLVGTASFMANYLKYSHVYIDNPVIKVLVLLLLFTGLIVSLFRIKDPHHSFLVAGIVGIGLSAPLIFWAYDAYRAYIVSSSFDAALVAVGAGFIIKHVRTNFLKLAAFEATTADEISNKSAVYPSIAIMLLLVAGPIVALSTYRAPVFSQPLTCDTNEKLAVLHIGRSSPYLEIVQHGSRSLVPRVPADRMAGIDDIHDFGLDAHLRAVQPGDMVIWGYNLLEPRVDKGFYFGRKAQLPTDGMYYKICGEKINLEESGTYWIVRINRAIPVVPD